MFDLYYIKDFSNQQRHKKVVVSFSNYKAYSDIKKIEHKKNRESSYFCYLERDENVANHLVNNYKQIFLYGSVFTNKKYFDETKITSQKVDIGGLNQLINEYKDTFVHYIKGSFVILIEDLQTDNVKLVSDALNVLPLYYSFTNNVLQISSNIQLILDSGLISKDLDELALTEQLIFDYMLEDHYFFKDIRKIENGRIYNFSHVGLKIKEYWNVEKLYHDELLGKKESLELLSSQLKENVKLYTSDANKILVSLTGGFDGRTNVAMLDKNPDEFLCYSYGKPGSKQIEVPKLISQRLNLNYKPIYLNEDFEKKYGEYADKVIAFSNGTAPISRANYPFAYEKLNSFSDVILTGLFGSEILRPIHRGLGIFTNNYVEELLLSEDFEKAKNYVYNELSKKNYLKLDILDKYYDQAIGIVKNYRQKYHSLGVHFPYFFFYIQEGIRKYFMQEIQIERPYVTTRFPYFDFDLVDLIYRTPFAGMYNGFLRKSKAKRRKGQLLYAHIIKKYKPVLGDIILDRGYKPKDLLRPFPINYTFLAKGVYKAKRYIKKYGNDTFDTSGNWQKSTISSTLVSFLENDVFNRGLKQNFSTGEYLTDSLRYQHFISLIRFLNQQ